MHRISWFYGYTWVRTQTKTVMLRLICALKTSKRDLSAADLQEIEARCYKAIVGIMNMEKAATDKMLQRLRHNPGVLPTLGRIYQTFAVVMESEKGEAPSQEAHEKVLLFFCTILGKEMFNDMTLEKACRTWRRYGEFSFGETLLGCVYAQIAVGLPDYQRLFYGTSSYHVLCRNFKALVKQSSFIPEDLRETVLSVCADNDENGLMHFFECPDTHSCGCDGYSKFIRGKIDGRLR